MIKELQPALEKKCIWAKNVLINLPVHTIDIKHSILSDIEQTVSQFERDCKIAIRTIDILNKKYATENDIPLDKQSEIKKLCHHILNKQYETCHTRIMAYIGIDIRNRTYRIAFVHNG